MRTTIFRSAIILSAALAVGLPTGAHACDACNNAFLQELVAKRGESLAGSDLLKAIHNQEGLPLTTASASQDAAPGRTPPPRDFDSLFGDAEFIDIIRRDESLSTTPTSFVPQDTVPDKEFTIELNEGKTYLGQGVMYDGFLTDGTVPGPTLVVQEGDIVKMNIVNTGTVPHGASIHAAYTQTSKYVGKIDPGQTKSVTFRANTPGVYMYHCAPGGHAIPMHVLFGQYGMIVVEPKKKYRLEEELGHGPDLNLYMLQHEFYTSGKDAVEGSPLYTAFNGKVFRYIEEPITVKPGDYVRINLLNVGPNLLSTFHIVGIIWDYVYWQGHPDAVMAGGQTVTAGPSDSWVIEFRVPPDEGAYLILNHAVGSTSRGAIGVLAADRNADTPKTVMAQGPSYSAEEITEMSAKAVRTISPFKPAPVNSGMPAEADIPVVYGPEVDEVTVRIIGNSYYPKIIEVEPGTRITWVNEDVFTYMQGEFSGIHNAVGIQGPATFATPLLAHGESASVTLTEAGVYEYMCTPHPYMAGRIIVREPSAGATGSYGPMVMPVAVLALVLALIAGGLALRPRL